MTKKKEFLLGLKDGLPICFGYFPVAFTFGLLAKTKGFSAWFSCALSALNLTSAGQFAALSLLGVGTTVIELFLTTVVVNLRYVLMSLALSQKIEPKSKWYHRLIMSYGITDEIYAIASTRPFVITTSYMLGITLLPLIGWSSGALAGGLAGSLLSTTLQNAMGIALYAMFLCIIIPPSRKSLKVALCCVVAGALSCVFYFLPFIRENISEGFRLIICAIFTATLFALIFPIKNDENKEEAND